MKKSTRKAMDYFEQLFFLCNRSNEISFKVTTSGSSFGNVIGMEKETLNVSLDLNYAIFEGQPSELTAKKIESLSADSNYVQDKIFDTAVENLLRKIINPNNTFILFKERSAYIIEYDAKSGFKMELALK